MASAPFCAEQIDGWDHVENSVIKLSSGEALKFFDKSDIVESIFGTVGDELQKCRNRV